MNKWVNPLEPIIYTPDAIDRDLKRIVGRSYFEDPIIYPLFETLYNTGCRAGEVLDLSRWKIAEGGAVVLSPQKGNDKRIMNQEVIGDQFLAMIKGEAPFPTAINYDRLRYQFKALSLYHHMYVGDKKASLHLFRHNFVKKLLASGHDEEEIQEILGERNIKSVKSYTESKFTNRAIKEY